MRLLKRYWWVVGLAVLYLWSRGRRPGVPGGAPMQQGQGFVGPPVPPSWWEGRV